VEDNLISNAAQLGRLISPEILEEIRDSFLQKYGVGICIYDCQGNILVRQPDSLPSLAHLISDQKQLFHVFFEIGDKIESISNSTEPIIQQFADGLILQSLVSIVSERELLGVACIVDIRRFIDTKKDKDVLDSLAKINDGQVSIAELLDENQAAVTGDFLTWNKELRDVLQLFVEAGRARAHIDNVAEAASNDVAQNLVEAKTGILFCTTNGLIIEALPDAAELLGYEAPQDLCDLNIFDDLVDENSKKQLRLMALEQRLDPVSVSLSKKDKSTIEATLQFIPQENEGVTFGFECHLIAHQTPFLKDVQEYERDQTAIGLIEESSQDNDEFELPGHYEDFVPEDLSASLKEEKNEARISLQSLSKGEQLFKSPITMLSHFLNASETPTVVIDSNNRIQLWNSALMGSLNIETKLLQKADVTSLLVTNIHSTWQRWRERMLQAPDGAVLKPKVLLPLIKTDGSVLMSSVRLRKVDLFGSVYLILTLADTATESISREADADVATGGVVSQNIESKIDFNSIAGIQQHYKNVRSQFSQLAEILAENVSHIYLESLQNEESKKRYAAIKRIADVSAYIERNLSYFTQESKPTLAPTDVNYIIGEIRDRLQQFLPININLQSNLDESLNMISADQDMLVHALGTICKNAIDAMPGGGTLDIQTKMDKSGENVIIMVSDSGSGISNTSRDQLMLPFFSTKKKSLGKGLGLAAAYGIVKAHAGELFIETQSDKGTTIVATFPALIDKDQAAGDTGKDSSSHKGFVLVIDDEIDIAEATATALTRDGYFVITSSSCADGLAMFEMYRDEIDVVVIDNLLRESTGLACAEKILECDENTHFVFYSGADDDFKLAGYIKRSGSGWLQKPFKIKELIVQIENQLAIKNIDAH
jgi:signal transduction histidine kinase/CheY-like chemotaxis protein/PAS domain-containing protein